MSTAIDLQYGENNRVQGKVYHGGVAGDALVLQLQRERHRLRRLLYRARRRIGGQSIRGSRRTWSTCRGRLDSALNNRVRLFVKAAFDDQSRRGPYQNASTDTDLFHIAGGIGVSFESAGTLNIRAMYATET